MDTDDDRAFWMAIRQVLSCARWEMRLMLIKARHHGQEHISLGNIAEMLRLLEKEEEPDALNFHS